MSVEGEGVLSRWSRLKRGGKTAQEIDRETEREAAASERAGGEARAEAGNRQAADAAVIEARTDAADAGMDAGADDPERMLTEEDLPDIDSLTAESDFTAFLQKNVPDHLHKLALRKLWRSDPVLANLDGLNDYDTDYTIKEVYDIAAQSAQDLARGAKRLTVSDMRAQETDARKRAEFEKRSTKPPKDAAIAQANLTEGLDGLEGQGSDTLDPASEADIVRLDRSGAGGRDA